MEALEAVWGWELPPVANVLVSIPRPWGFVVAERRPGRLVGGEWLVYLVEKVGVPSGRVVSRLLSAVGGVEARISGLKDADAVAYQYVYVRGGRPIEKIVGEGWRAWLVGFREKPPGLGGHMWNLFRLTLEVVDGDPVKACEALSRVRLTPGLYGPQRFGVKRPNTHLAGLYLSLGAWGRLLAEMGYEYPWGGAPGGYEARSLEESVKAGAPRIQGVPRRLSREAVQSYVWNRAASKALLDGVEKYAERKASTPCPRPGRALVARLPDKSMVESPRTSWEKLVASIVEEEGIPSLILPARAPRRALAAEPCMLKCREDGGRLVLWASLPRGLFATSLVRAAVWVDWLSALG